MRNNIENEFTGREVFCINGIILLVTVLIFYGKEVYNSYNKEARGD